MKNDTNFNDRSQTFAKNIYGTGKGKIREAVLLRDLAPFVNTGETLSILDIGGGQGQIALQLAQLGHKVTITDISESMLAEAQQRAQEQQLDVAIIHSPLQELSSQLNDQFDLVLCHAVFEWLDEPELAVDVLESFVKPSGLVSLMFYNKAGQELSNLVYGNFDYIKKGMKTKKVVKLNPQSSLAADDVLAWCDSANLSLVKKTGVRCFHDYMRDISKWDSDFDGILEMELKYSEQEPFANIGRYMHLILQQG